MDDKRIFNEEEEEVLTLQMQREKLVEELKNLNEKIEDYI